jgi:hypothetical protein
MFKEFVDANSLDADKISPTLGTSHPEATCFSRMMSFNKIEDLEGKEYL